MAVSELTARTARMHLADLDEQSEAERIERCARAWAAYDDEGPLAFDDPEDRGDCIRLGYAKLIVDKGVSFLAGKGGVSLQLEQIGDDDDEALDEPPGSPEDETAEQDRERGDELAEARAEAILDAVWPEEQRHLDFHQLAINGGVCGHAWLRLYETGKVAVLDPSNVTVEWDEDDLTIVERYLLTWNTVDRDTGMGVARRKRYEPDNPEEPTSWTIYDEEYDDDAGVWRLLDETPWLHEFPPLIGAQNLPAANTYYGAADLEPGVLDMVEQLEAVASDMRRMVRMYGHPTPVVIGEEAHRLQQIDVSIGELLAIPNADAKLGQLAIAELTSALALYKELKTALFEAVRIPKVALGETTGAGPESGVALQVEYEPLIEKTETKRLTYGLLLRQTAERVLTLCGQSGWKVTLGWPQLLPSDEVSEAQTAAADLGMGIVSKQTIAEKRGYDWDVERLRLADEKADPVLNPPPPVPPGGGDVPPVDQPPEPPVA